MGKDFEIRLDATVTATPDQIWDAIATGPGISSWFIGSTDIDGDTVRTSFGGGTIPVSTIATSDPPHHFVHRSDDLANEFLIEARDGSATVLRSVTSGFLAGDDWAEEYEAMTYGTQLFFATLVEYLNHFPGRPTTPVTVFGPPVTDWPTTWRNLHAALDQIGGEIYFTNPHTVGLRTDRGLYRFLRSFRGPLIAAHALVTPDDTDWNTYLAKL